MNNADLQIHRCRWILPVCSNPVENGALACAKDKILDVGNWHEINKSYPGAKIIDHGESILLPGLINCHTHLDNSALLDKLTFKRGSMSSWINGHFRARMALNNESHKGSLKKAWQELYRQGTMAVADITYTDKSIELALASPIISQLLFEVVGLSQERAENSMEKAQNLLNASPEELFSTLAAHAPHTLNRDALLKIISSNRKAGRLSSIHLAESPEEVEFLNSGSGPFKDALQEWNFWDPRFQVPHCSPAAYLNKLNLLGPDLLAVHCVHLSNADMDLLKKHRTKLCLCPRSNEYIGNGLPDIVNLLKREIPLCLGTDGLASNYSLSLFDEMDFIRNNFPSISPSTLLQMATINGAAALGKESYIGSLEKNKLARFLIYKEYNGKKPVEEITRNIKPGKLEWAGEAVESKNKRGYQG